MSPLTSDHNLPTAEQIAYGLASDALNAALEGDWDRATRTVQAINDECAGEGLAEALLVWSDAVIHYIPGWTLGAKITLSFTDIHIGPLCVEHVPPRELWAGRLIAARAAYDRPMWQALIDAMPPDPADAGTHVASVLEIAARTISHLREGRS